MLAFYYTTLQKQFTAFFPFHRLRFLHQIGNPQPPRNPSNPSLITDLSLPSRVTTVSRSILSQCNDEPKPVAINFLQSNHPSRLDPRHDRPPIENPIVRLYRPSIHPPRISGNGRNTRCHPSPPSPAYLRSEILVIARHPRPTTLYNNF